MEKLKEEGYKLVALEQTNKSHVLWEYKFDRKTVVIVGNGKNELLQPVTLVNLFIPRMCREARA